MKKKLIFVFAIFAISIIVMGSQASAETTIVKGIGILEANGAGTVIFAGIGNVSVDGTGDILIIGRNVIVDMQGFNCTQLAPMITVCKGTGYGNIMANVTGKPKNQVKKHWIKRNFMRVVFSGTADNLAATGKGRAVLMGEWDYTKEPLHGNGTVNLTGEQAVFRKCMQEAREDCMANMDDAQNGQHAVHKCLRKAKKECLKEAKPESI